ncbi:glycoside hydrolase family 13 protein [Arenicella xantha]|uniref:Glycosidase n=1 Tax=Arenicella xantha TaxID=644221 RepID=A0A395JL22_9GAMM|nr:glycoside hydrolase family 13 protein [Arenicella xantha]RBP49742.1 glycosidase [Arenicella xantha]
MYDLIKTAVSGGKTILLLTLLILPLQTSAASVERIEPPFWWAGMVSNKLQLMVSGPNVGKMRVSTAAPFVKISRQSEAQSPNYLFVDLELLNGHTAGRVAFEFTATDGSVSTHEYEFKQRRKDSANRTGFSAKDVIYLVTPDRFANGDLANDSVASLREAADRGNPDGRHGGDLIGLADNLEYLNQLGITQIWLNPLQENDQERYSYHGYSVSDLYNIDARLGGNAALLAVTAKAKSLGIGLIMDTIPNHIGLNHWWMNDLPSSDWVNNDGEFFQTSHRHEMVQDPYAPASDKREFSDGWFVPTMPDLNQRNPYLANYLIQNNIWWVEYADLTGLRVDTLPYADKHFTQEFSNRLLSEYPDFNIVGEEWSTNISLVSYWQRGKRNQDGFDANIPSLMDFPLQDALIKALTEPATEPNSATTGLLRIHGVLANDFQYPKADDLVVIGDNHDMSRLYTWLHEDIRLYKMALSFLMTTRGVPQLFYGTEILMKNPGTEEHGIIRSDFPGGWPDDQRNAFTGEGMAESELQAQAFVRKLLNWRKQSAAVHSGALVHYLPRDGVYTYFRQTADESVMVVMNNSEQVKELETQRFSESTRGYSSMRDVFIGSQQRIASTIKVPAKSARIFELIK